VTRLGDRSGFALVTVLWLLVVVGSAAAAFQAAGRAERRAAANAVAEARGRWAARAGLARALVALDRELRSGARGGGSAWAGGTYLQASRTTVGEIEVAVATLDARARLNLNSADGDELRSLFTAVGMRRTDAAALADVVLDWRDRDNDRRPRGAETREYLAKGPLRPGNGPFQRADELLDLIGVTSEVYELIEPHVGVTGDSLVNVNTASVPVLTALPGVSPVAAAAIIARRRARRFRTPFEVLAALPEPQREAIRGQMDAFVSRAAFTPRDLEIVATATVPGSAVAARVTALVHLAGGARWELVRVVDR